VTFRLPNYRTLANVLNCRVSALHLRSTAIVTWLTEHDDVIQSLHRVAPRPGLALGPAPDRADPGNKLFMNRNVTTDMSRDRIGLTAKSRPLAFPLRRVAAQQP